MTSLISSFVCCGFVTIAKGGDFQDICDLMLGTYVNIELANTLTKCTLLVIWQIQDEFNASRNKVSSLSVKTMQVYPRNKLRSASSLKLDSQHVLRFKKLLSPCARHLLDTSYLSRFKKETEILIYFLGIHECVFGTSFLLTLNIYKAYFRDHHVREYKENICKR